ncbi:MAG: hypothetical protein AB7O96_13790 [Pseudobdellovibrionaceae bacterium]
MSSLSLTKFSTIVYAVLTVMFLYSEIVAADACQDRFRACKEDQKNETDPSKKENCSTILITCKDNDKCESVLKNLDDAIGKYSEACAKIGANDSDEDGCKSLIESCQDGQDSLIGGVMNSMSAMMIPAGGMAPGVSSGNKACSQYTHKEWKEEKKDLQDRMNDSQKDIIKAQKDATDKKKEINEKIGDTMKDFNGLKKDLEMAGVKLRGGIRGVKNDTLKLIHEIKAENDKLHEQIAELQAEKAQVSVDLAAATADHVQECVKRNEETKLAVSQAKSKPGAITGTNLNDTTGKNNSVTDKVKKAFIDCLNDKKRKIAMMRRQAEGKLRRLETGIESKFQALRRNEEKIKQYQSNLAQAVQDLQETSEIEKKNAVAAIQTLLSNVDNLNNSLNEMNQNTQMEIQLAQQKMMGTQMELANLMSNQPKPGATMTFSDAQGAKAKMEAMTKRAEDQNCLKGGDSGSKTGGAKSEPKE